MSKKENEKLRFNRDILRLDAREEVHYICENMREYVHEKLKKKGVVIGVSGGIDSSLVAALCVKIFGTTNTYALSMPEDDSSMDTEYYTELISDSLKLDIAKEPISNVLRELNCYQRRNDAIRMVIPSFEDHWKCKIVLPNYIKTGQLNFYSIVVQDEKENRITKRLSLKAYQQIVAASNFKQRIRKIIEYYHAERLNYAVVGTPNFLEYDQGFFVRYGDGAADIKPIAHLYKTQVYQLAQYLNVPDEIIIREPTTDTYSLDQGQDEFYFSIPHEEMDLCLYAFDNHVPIEEVSTVLNYKAEQIERIYRNISQKRRVANFLNSSPKIFHERSP